MRPGLYALPFFAVVIAAMATVLKSAFPTIPWMAQISYASAGALIVLWVVLEYDHIKSAFSRRGSKYGFGSGVSVLLGVLIIIGLGVLTSRPRFNKSFDATRGGLNTLSEQSVKMAEKSAASADPVSVTAFLQEDEAGNTFRDLMRLYTQVAPGLQVEYVDPRSDPGRVGAEKVTAGNTAIFRRGIHEARVTQFTEEKITNALVAVLKDTSKKIYFTKGHGEGELRSDEATGFSAAVAELEGNKYEVADLSLLEKGAVPSDADLVVIAGPVYDFREEELRMLQDYLKSGGALLSLVDAAKPVRMLNKLLADYGIQFNDDFLILRPDDPRAAILGQNMALISKFDAYHSATKDFAEKSSVVLTMANSRSITMTENPASGVKVETVAYTSPVIVGVSGVVDEQSLKQVSPERIQEKEFGVVAIAAGKVSGATVAEAGHAKSEEDRSDVAQADSAATGKEVRIVAVGSSHLASNYGAQLSENRDMFVNLANYLLQDEDFISIRPKDAEKSTFNLASGGSQLLLFFLCFVYPFLFLGGGALVWMRRKAA